MTAKPYPSARPGRRPERAMSRASGQLASAVPSAPTATGRPDHVFVPVMLAARMLPIAMPIECPVLPHTCATNSVAINVPRTDRRLDVVVSVFTCRMIHYPSQNATRPLSPARRGGNG